METNLEKQIDNFLLNFKKKTIEADFFLNTGLSSRSRSNSMEMDNYGKLNYCINVKFKTRNYVWKI